MFGSDGVQPYIGELWIANKADAFLKDSQLAQEVATQMEQQQQQQSSSLDDDETATNTMQSQREERVRQLLDSDDLVQRKRQVQCAIHIRKRVAPFTEDDMEEAEFLALLQAEAADICKSSFGHVFCTTIGRTLELEATEFLGFAKNAWLGSWDAHAAVFSKKSQSISNNWKVATAGLSAVRAGTEAMKHVETVQKQQKQKQQQQQQQASSSQQQPMSPSMDAANQAKETMDKLEDTLPAILELAWAINVRDITRTLKQVCHKLFHDASVDKDVRLKRAEAIRMLGREFYAIGKASEALNHASSRSNKEEIKLRAEIAAMTTLAKAQGQEITEQDAEYMIRQQREMKQQQQQETTPFTVPPES
jgi:hypothetical protein